MLPSPRPLSKRKIDAISNGSFLVAIGILFFTNTWWPGILLAIWVSLGLRQYLSNRIYDFALSSVILLGLFLIIFFKIEWSILIPVLFVTGGIYIIFREYFFAEETEEEKLEDIKDDIDDDTSHHHS